MTLSIFSADWRNDLIRWLTSAFQPLSAALTSWAGVTRASGFDTFAATPSSANLAALLTDETGTGANVFANAPTITGVPVFSGIPSLAGGAISFPATQIPSADPNTLDDYEEGTFTPVIVGSTASGVGTYTSQIGRYTKIGRAVSVVIEVVWTAHTGTGNISVGGLPFIAATGVGFPASIYASNLTFSGQLGIGFASGASTATLLSTTSNTGLGAVAMDTSASVFVAGTYFV